jgi:hypothetical protein
VILAVLVTGVAHTQLGQKWTRAHAEQAGASIGQLIADPALDQAGYGLTADVLRQLP